MTFCLRIEELEFDLLQSSLYEMKKTETTRTAHLAQFLMNDPLLSSEVDVGLFDKEEVLKDCQIEYDCTQHFQQMSLNTKGLLGAFLSLNSFTVSEFLFDIAFI